MLATLCLLPLLSFPFTYAATEILNASDSSLVFSPGWSQELFTSTGNSVLQTDTFGGSLTASLPNSTSSVSYAGFNTAGGSMYGYTIDCEEDCVLRTVDGSDPSLNDGEIASEPSTLFTIDLDPTSQHILRVFNIPSDTDDGSSQITFDHLNISVQNDGASLPNVTGILEPISSTVVSAGSTSSTSSPSSTAKAPATSAKVKATSSGDSASPSSSLPTGSATSTSPSQSASGDDQPSAATPVLPVATSVGSSSASSGGVSKSVIIAATVLSLVFAGGFVAMLVVLLRQRRKKRDAYAFSQDGSGTSSRAGSGRPSSTGSIIPIMDPPQMRTTSLNPFSDPPFAEVALDSPGSGSLMQRIDTRPASPGAPPNIPLPALPLDRRPKMESRNDLWIARTPVKSTFSAV